VITDDELLAACRSAGEPGSESHRLACRLYRRAALEWKAGHAGWRREYALRAAAETPWSARDAARAAMLRERAWAQAA
jgi:hypothetical protein